MSHLIINDTLRFVKDGHDSFIDFLKGFSIICVILNHCLPSEVMASTAFFFWGSSAVPIFILIQVFHAYKKPLAGCRVHLGKIWHRVVWPFLLCQLVIALIVFWKNPVHSPQTLMGEAVALVKSGGYGPGAYYPWIYVQMALLLPWVAIVFRKLQRRPWLLCLLFVVASQGAETTCVLLPMPQLAYRLLFVRYIFLFYLGYLMATKGFAINGKTLLVATVCVALSGYIVYGQPDGYPWIYPFVNPVCHWFCYLYIVWLLLWLLRKLFDALHVLPAVRRTFELAGVYSYELFLLQMVFFIIIG